MTSKSHKTIFFKLAITMMISGLLAACLPANTETVTLNKIILPAAVAQPLPQLTLNPLSRREPLGTSKEWISYTNGNDVSDIAIDRDGNLWTAGRGGVVVWNPGEKTYQKYTISNGLPENDVTALAIAPDGKLWSGTYAGHLSFFSEGKWSIVDQKPADTITDIAVTTNGTVWVGTNQGIHSFDGANWHSYTTTQGLLDNFIQTIAVASDGTVWAGSIGGISFFNDTGWHSRRIATGSTIASIAEAPDRSVWVGSDHALIHFDGTAWTSYETGDDASLGLITSIAISQQGEIWFTSTRLGVVHLDKDQKSFTNYDLPDIASVVFGPDNHLWLGGSYKGLSLFTEKSLNTYTTEDANISNFVISSAIGNDGALWFGTNQGASTYNRQTWQSYTTRDGLANDSVISIAAAPDGSTWFGTENGVSRFDGSTWKNFTTQDGLPNKQVRSINITPNGTVWLATQNGLSWYDGQTWNSATPSDGFAENTTFRASATSSNGTVWIGTRHGLANFDRQRWLDVSIPFNDIITSIAVSEKNDLWIGTRQSGMIYINSMIWDQIPKDGVQSVSVDSDTFRYATIGPSGDIQMMDGTGQFLQTHTQDQGLPGNKINAIKISADGSPWVATNNGVAHLTPNGWVTYNTQNGLGDNNVMTLVIDQQGNIWAGMPMGGIAQFIP